MIYFDSDIMQGLEEGKIIIDPFIEDNLGPNSYDVRLDEKLLIYQPPVFSDGNIRYLDMRHKNPTREVKIPEDGYVLHPGTLYLGSTMEVVGSRDECVPHIEGRSSIGRLGMGIHVTAGFGDCGFIGHWTMEITVVHPLKVYAGERVAQAYFIEGKGVCLEHYKGKYHSFDGPVASMKWKEAAGG